LLTNERRRGTLQVLCRSEARLGPGGPRNASRRTVPSLTTGLGGHSARRSVPVRGYTLVLTAEAMRMWMAKKPQRLQDRLPISIGGAPRGVDSQGQNQKMSNKPNLPKAQLPANLYSMQAYGNRPARWAEENKPKQSQFQGHGRSPSGVRGALRCGLVSRRWPRPLHRATPCVKSQELTPLLPLSPGERTWELQTKPICEVLGLRMRVGVKTKPNLGRGATGDARRCHGHREARVWRCHTRGFCTGVGGLERVE